MQLYTIVLLQQQKCGQSSTAVKQRDLNTGKPIILLTGDDFNPVYT